MHLILLIRHFKSHSVRSTTCRMRKNKWCLTLSGFEMCENFPVTVLVQFCRRCSSVQNTDWDRVEGMNAALVGKVRSLERREDGEYGKLLSWPEDLEPARFHPPCRSRLAQPCRRRAPSPLHLERTHTQTHRLVGPQRSNTIFKADYQ